jgi:tetratricopeptide (TPR) repeat protein
MSNETFQIVVLGLLGVLVLLQIFDLRLQKGALDGLKDAMDEQSALKKRKHHDIGEIIETKNYEKALRESEKRLSTNLNDPALLWYKGIALYHLENWEGSIEAFQKAIEYEPLYEKDLESYINVLTKKLEKGRITST